MAPLWCCRGQFNHGESSKQASGKKNAVPPSAKSRKQSKKTNVEEVSQGSGSWVNPKSSTKIPKNAGKRRVQACGQSTQSAGQSTQSVGHWYTGSNGKRVSKSLRCVYTFVPISVFDTIIEGVAAINGYKKLCHC